MRALLLAIAVCAPAVASAQSFEAAADAATHVTRIDDIVWAFTGTCRAGTPLEQRQCRLVRDQRRHELAGAALLVDADASALEVGTWNPQKRSLAITLTACIRCAGVEVEGKTWYVTGAAPRLDGGRVRGKLLHETTQTVKDAASATAWAKSVANARVQLIVRVPAQPTWHAGGKNGLALEVLAFRAASPCDGAIIVAQPASAPMPPDKQACAGTPVGADTPRAKLPPALTGAMIRQTLQPVVDAANACFARYKITGKAKLVFTVNADGSVARYEQQGELVGTPLEACIDTAAKRVVFPATEQPQTKFSFPIILS